MKDAQGYKRLPQPSFISCAAPKERKQTKLQSKK